MKKIIEKLHALVTVITIGIWLYQYYKLNIITDHHVSTREQLNLIEKKLDKLLSDDDENDVADNLESISDEESDFFNEFKDA